MYKIALKMLIEDRAKFIGMVLSLSFSALIITQQASIFVGIMMRTYGTITDTPQAEIWVMDLMFGISTIFSRCVIRICIGCAVSRELSGPFPFFAV